MSNQGEKWDYIVIGAGSGGCALAHELAKSSRNPSILVLEAGGSDRSPYIKVPAGVLKACARHDWGYRAQPDPSRDEAIEYWLRGKVLGGCSSINGTIYVRGAAEDFDRWSAMCGHIGGWAAREVMPIFGEMETSDQQGPTRGRRGPLYVRTVRRPHAVTDAFLESALSAGYPVNDDYNGETQEGVSYIQLSQRRGFRCSAADAFLKPLLARNRIKLMLNAFVERIEIEGDRAVAVSFQHGGSVHRESARDIILCAGAINSPKLLMLSGIGDARELERHKVNVTVDLPGVGRNLRDHPLVRLTYRTNTSTYNLTQGLRQKLTIGAKFLFEREGPIANLFEAMGFLKSGDGKRNPDIQLFFLTVGYTNKPDGHWKIAPYPAVMLYVANSYPVANGRVSLASNNPQDPPLIDYALLSDQADMDTMIRGIQLTRRIMSKQPIAKWVEEEVLPGADIADPAALASFVRKNANICYHSIGTCRMGTDPDAVTDPHLRVRGLQNLWIADASIMPDPISANTNAACMMIGMKLGKQLTARD